MALSSLQVSAVYNLTAFRAQPVLMIGHVADLAAFIAALSAPTGNPAARFVLPAFRTFVTHEASESECSDILLPTRIGFDRTRVRQSIHALAVGDAGSPASKPILRLSEGQVYHPLILTPLASSLLHQGNLLAMADQSSRKIPATTKPTIITC